MTNRYYVTRYGIAASLVNAKTHQEIREALEGHSHALTIQRLVRDGIIAVDQRSPMEMDHNSLALNGVLDQVRQVITSIQVPTLQSKSNTAPTLPTRTEGKQHWGRTPVGYVALPPKARMPSMAPSAKSVYEALRDTPQSAQELARKFRNLNPSTVRWALQFLRSKGLAESQPLAA